MKKLISVLLAFVFGMFLIFPSCSGGGEESATGDSTQVAANENVESEASTGNSDGGIYTFESAKIVSEMTMMGQKTTSTVYIDDYGKKMVTDMDMLGMKMRTIILGDYSYMLDMAKKTGQKYLTAGAENDEEFSVDEISDIESLTTEQLSAKGIKKVGTEKVLDYDCTIYEMTEEGQTVKMWIWKNYPLKIVSNAEGMEIKSVVTSLEIDADIPANMFEVPADFKITDMSAMQNGTN